MWNVLLDAGTVTVDITRLEIGEETALIDEVQERIRVVLTDEPGDESR